MDGGEPVLSTDTDVLAALTMEKEDSDEILAQEKFRDGKALLLSPKTGIVETLTMEKEEGNERLM